jgi:thiamine-phosphate pyrophosphorylase
MRGLYLVTPNWDDTARLLDCSEQALKAGVALLQYRHKSATPALRREQASALQVLCRAYGCPFIINDFVDLCIELDADGVHLGGMDDKVAQVRERLGPDKIIGASCYGDLALAHAAQEGGASYLAFGGFYPSQVKVYPVTTPAQIVSDAKAALTLPLVVIGGMTIENAAPLVARGADMVAAITSVYQAPDIAAAVRGFAGMF